MTTADTSTPAGRPARSLDDDLASLFVFQPWGVRGALDRLTGADAAWAGGPARARGALADPAGGSRSPRRDHGPGARRRERQPPGASTGSWPGRSTRPGIAGRRSAVADRRRLHGDPRPRLCRRDPARPGDLGRRRASRPGTTSARRISTVVTDATGEYTSGGGAVSRPDGPTRPWGGRLEAATGPAPPSRARGACRSSLPFIMVRGDGAHRGRRSHDRAQSRTPGPWTLDVGMARKAAGRRRRCRRPEDGVEHDTVTRHRRRASCRIHIASRATGPAAGPVGAVRHDERPYASRGLVQPDCSFAIQKDAGDERHEVERDRQGDGDRRRGDPEEADEAPWPIGAGRSRATLR